ncbi:twin-arginine translocase subunit TatC [Halorubrum lipolyticum]|uniref:Sec-independent protein translocase protein TatC n=1 Tax=Halorubrum lipolyticum DSM 21995 TaxID=1227482 RepID=M0NQQ5_9EURY|nr:twin-arginine translocase subunit TatC [Halorubrum lipolyticum]EMA60277.1 Sec-independent periplasmic protein translocase [Halorubrum lipolyticum DSM 21995]
MDDSDRSRDEPSAPEDDSVADDGTVDSADDGTVEPTETGETTAEDGRAASGERGGDAESESVESEVSPAVTPEIGSDDADGAGGAGDAGESEDRGADDADGADSADDEEGTFDAHEPGSAKYLNDSEKPELEAGSSDGDPPGDGDEGADADAPTVEDGGVAGEGVDGGGAADGGAADEEFAGLEAPETDEEMPLAAHIEEMMRRLAVVFLFGGLATLVVVTESTELINYFWSYHIPAPLENRPRLYGPLELPLTRLKVAGLAGVVVGLPAFVYQTYRFMKPGLYPTERRYYLAAVPTSLVLGGVGIAFAHFLVLPAIFSYFTTYTSDAATIAFGLAETFNLIVIMLAFMAIVFQIPLFIMLAIMMNLVTRRWLEAKRLIFWGSFLGIAFLFSPDPTGMAPIIVTLTMIVLFEGTLAILRWTGN